MRNWTALLLIIALALAAADQGDHGTSSNSTAAAVVPAVASNVTLPAAAQADNSSSLNATAVSPNSTATGLNINDEHTTDASAAQWHGSRRHHGVFGPGSGSVWHDGWQGGFQVDQSDDRRSAALPACPPGQGRPSPSEACQLCPYGRFSPGGLTGPCLRCPAGTVTINPGSTECGCKPGTGTLTINEGPCQPCPNGTYAPGGSITPCLRCPGSAFMVTPPMATRVSQCTCKPGFGSTTDWPQSCQMCPIGTYANALAQIINIPGVPPQGGKGITGGLAGATFKPCIPCCPAGVGTCGLTTNAPGSTKYQDCVLVKPDVTPYCCGVDTCTTPVPRPPTGMSAAVAAAAAAAAAKPDFQTTYQGMSVTVMMPAHSMDSAGSMIVEDEFSGSARRERVTGGRRPRGGNSWDGDEGDDSSSSSGGGGWNSGGSSWNRGSSGSWGGSSGGSSWDRGARSRSWGATISDGVVDKDNVVGLQQLPSIMQQQNSSSNADGSSSNSSSTDSSTDSAAGSISSTDQVGWWGDGAPGPKPLGTCAANPRVAETNLVGLAANTPWVLSYYADLTPGSTCRYTPSAGFLINACTGSQIAPYLTLTAAHCVDPVLNRIATGCPNLVLVNVVLCYSFNRQPGGSFQCGDNGVPAVGASWYDRDNSSSAGPVTPNDYAIVFLGTPRPGPFYQYNYIENSPNAYTSTANNFQSLAYSGDGSTGTQTTPGGCGCSVCPSMPCGLGRSGPTPGPLQQDARQPNNGAVNVQLEACGGSSGNCMTINGRSCCMAIDSYEYRAASADSCANVCQNYWSTISAQKPLANLWAQVRWTLPRTA